MKPGAILLNVARGGVVDEAAVADALRDGRLGGAAIDVFEHEPPTGSPLLDAPNTLLTPHLGASTAEAQVAVAEEVAEQVLDVLAGRPRALRGQRAAAHAGDGPGDRAVPAPGRDARPVLRPVRARTGVADADRRGGRRARRHDATPLTAAALRGLLETATTERVNLVNAGALAKARGHHRRRAQDPRRRRVRRAADPVGRGRRPDDTVAGTVAAGEPRLVRLDDYRLDMEPTDVMLITRHHDRPGTIGRIGLMLGEADVNISAMHLARSAPRADALMILALDDDVPAAVADGDPVHGGGPRPVDDPARERER